MSQTHQILKHLKTGNTITPLEALDKFNVMRLGARINDLRNLGHNIITETVHAGNKHYARYRLQNPFTEL